MVENIKKEICDGCLSSVAEKKQQLESEECILLLYNNVASFVIVSSRFGAVVGDARFVPGRPVESLVGARAVSSPVCLFVLGHLICLAFFTRVIGVPDSCKTLGSLCAVGLKSCGCSIQIFML